MWNFVFASARGTSHLRTGQPCQDASGARVVEGPTGPVLVAACADGAGSAELSQVGAELAVETILEEVARSMGQGVDPAEVDEAVLRAWNDLARRRVLAEAERRGVPARQLACTLLAAVVGPGTSAFSQVGDGVIVFDGPDGYEYAFWPDSGEYANTTRFLTDGDFEERLRIDVLPRPVRDLALLTDGLQPLALGYAEGRVHDRFFRPMFDALRAAPGGEALRPDLDAFLQSKRVNERTDDDKTLILATCKAPSDHGPGDRPSTD